MKLWVALALAGCLALPLAARSVRGRAEGRAPRAHLYDPDSAAELIIPAVQQGVPRERLLDVSTAALQQVQRGLPRAEALAIVRRQLPNLPAPSKPTRGNVAGARRPAAPPP